MLVTLLLLICCGYITGLNEFRTWSNLSICDKAQNVNYPFAYSKYTSQIIENKGRVNSNLQDFRHECQTRGGQSKCYICEEITCSSDTGTCNLQLQGVSTSEMSVNIPTISDIVWAVGGNYRTDYGGSQVSHYCIFISGGPCLLPSTTSFNNCAIRCFGYGFSHPAVYLDAPAPILIEPDFIPLIDIGPSDLWVYPRNCSELQQRGQACSYSDLTGRVPSFNPQGFTFTLAGSGVSGFLDGSGSSAQFSGPEDVAVDSLGYVYVADTLNNAIRCIDPYGRVTTIAGGGPILTGYRDGNCSYALFSQPKGLDVKRTLNVITIIVSDTGNHRIRKIVLDNSTLSCAVTSGYADGAPHEARYSSPQGLMFYDYGGYEYVIIADTSNFLIRMLNISSENVSTLAGSTGLDPSGVPIAGCLSPCVRGIAGKRDGNLTYAQFYTPQDVSVGVNNTIYVADEHRIRVIELPVIITTLYDILSMGRVSTLAGGPVQGDEDGKGDDASLFYPSSVFVTADNIAYSAEAASCHIRRISPAPLVAQTILCTTRLTDVIRPSGCTSYDQTIDKISRKISRVEANVIYNYGSPYANDKDSGRYIKNCVGSPPLSILDKHSLNTSSDILVVDDGEISVDEDGEIGAAIIVACPSLCDLTAAVLEGGIAYSEQSSICAAGIHAGVMPSDGGILLVTVGRVSAVQATGYSGSTANGMSSSGLAASEQRTFSTALYAPSVVITHTVAGHPAAKLQDGCGYFDGQPSTLSYFKSPTGLAAMKNTSLTDSNFLYIADRENNMIRALAASCTQICENGARCIGPDKCACVSGWSGMDCSLPSCSTACSLNRVCTSPDTCTCKPGFTGAACNIPTCVQTCHNGGTCTSPDTCSCLPGWFDSNCTTVVCTQTCGNGGNCTAPSVCSCPSDWIGGDCRTPLCTTACLNGGLCVAPNTCQCPPQWSGYDCSFPVCTQGFFVPNAPVLSTHLFSSHQLRNSLYRPCNLKGWCNATNEFECDQQDMSYAPANVPFGGNNRAITGRKDSTSACMLMELPLTYEIPFTLLNADSSTTSFMRYTPFTPYLSNNSNPWRGYDYSPAYVRHTAPWTYAADRQIALVEFISMSQGVYVCANNGNCSAPDICECAPGWIGFDCRTPVCTQGYYQPRQARFVSGLETATERDDFLKFMSYNPVRLTWPYSNPQYAVDFEYYASVGSVVRQLQQQGNLTYLGPADWSSGNRVTTEQGGYRCSVRAVTQWENLNFILDNPNFYSRYMDSIMQLDGKVYTTWTNMHWPPVHSKSKKLDQVMFNITFAYTDEGYRRLGIWSRVANVDWQYGTCLLEFSRTCADPSKTLDLNSGVESVFVQDTDVSYRPRIRYSDFNVSSQGRWRAAGGECVDKVVRGCYNNGTCTAPDTCACTQGWTGSDCSVPFCSQACLHHGNCTLPDTCTCEKGWSGSDCSVAICAQECQNGGSCVAPDTCQCAQWANEFRDGRLGGGRPLFRRGNGDPQSTGWTGLDCSVPICVQAQTFLFGVPDATSPGYQVLGGHGGDSLLTCNGSKGEPVPRCAQYDQKVTSNDGRSFYTGCGYDPLDTGCCIIHDGDQVDCYQCPIGAVVADQHSLSCSSPLSILSGFTSQTNTFLNFLDSNGNFKLCGKYHIPRRFNDIISLTDYGTAVYFINTEQASPLYSSQNFRSNLTSNRFLCNRQFWTQGDYIDDAGLSDIEGDGTRFGLTMGRQFRINDPNYALDPSDVTRSSYIEGPKIPGEGLFECYNHGSCIGPDFCTCSDGWDGFDCSNPLCRHLQPSGLISGCLNGGLCVMKDDCQCIQTSSVLWEVFNDASKGLTGWTGSDCSIPMCSQGFFDPFCTDLPQAPAGEGCFRCNNGGNCTAPDVCTCADGWSGYNCLTPVCEVVADPLTRTQLNTIYEDKIVSFEADPCGVTAIYGLIPWHDRMYTLGNCTLPNQCTCLCTTRYDEKLCSPATSVNHCRGPWQDELIQLRDILSQRGPQYIFGTSDCERGYEGNIDETQHFTTCHQIIYVPTYAERFSRNIIAGTILGFVFGSLIYFFVRRRWKRKQLLEKIERRKQQREENMGAEDEEELLLQRDRDNDNV